MSRVDSLSIKRLWQVDNNTFGVEWNDDVVTLCRLSALQKRCPCAGCTDKSMELNVDDNVSAISIQGIGNYAIAVRFSSGCSSGIYDYPLLRSISEENR